MLNGHEEFDMGGAFGGRVFIIRMDENGQQEMVGIDRIGRERHQMSSSDDQ